MEIIMVITPDIKYLDYVYKDGVKLFTLVSEVVNLELIPGLFVRALGYNMVRIPKIRKEKIIKII